MNEKFTLSSNIVVEISWCNTSQLEHFEINFLKWKLKASITSNLPENPKWHIIISNINQKNLHMQKIIICLKRNCFISHQKRQKDWKSENGKREKYHKNAYKINHSSFFSKRINTKRYYINCITKKFQNRVNFSIPDIITP